MRFSLGRKRPKTEFSWAIQLSFWVHEINPKFFEGKAYVKSGIKQTPQMLLRLEPTIALKPSAVVILAGLNDIAGNTGTRELRDDYK
jgi:hypothetical protein